MLNIINVLKGKVYFEGLLKISINLGENKKAQLDAKNKLNKRKNDCIFASILYYYEIKIRTIGTDYSSFGFRNTKGYIVLGNAGYIWYSPVPLGKEKVSFQIPISWNAGDILGCGLVFPPTKMIEKHPYVFFTQNGNQIGKAVLLKEESDDYFSLYLSLNCLSIEANFGNDLDAKPFCFDVSKHLFAEEFYN
ncbi:unnamed protein product [Meloidogyne enterolobii]|uniref:Uncharacterized protein n=1 Tax=Meloidogyne enterolobii TaxID=390850 RepID=A0ACB0Y5K3_MELEN